MKGMTVADVAAKTATGATKVAAARSSRKLAQTAYPSSFDWRALGKVPPIRNQGNCGSCWSFAAIGALESKAMIDGVLAIPNLSEQQQVDCVNAAAGYWSQGCNGGYSRE